MQDGGNTQAEYPFILMFKHINRGDKHQQSGYHVKCLQAAEAGFLMFYRTCEVANGYAGGACGE